MSNRFPRARNLAAALGTNTPSYWAASRAEIIEANLKLLEEFSEHPSPAVRAFATKEKVRIGDAIKTKMRTEIQFDWETHERFE